MKVHRRSLIRYIILPITCFGSILGVLLVIYLLEKPYKPDMTWVSAYDLKEGNQPMVKLLDSIHSFREQAIFKVRNPRGVRGLFKQIYRPKKRTILEGRQTLSKGKLTETLKSFEKLIPDITANSDLEMEVLELMAVSHLRLGEEENCVEGHNAYSCLVPIQKEGIYQIQEHTQEAIRLYKTLLTRKPDDWRYRWLLNLAYQTIGEYPEGVPSEWLIESPFLDDINPDDNFYNMAPSLGIDEISLAGGAIMDDFNNDGLLDLMSSGWKTSPLKFYINQGSAGFFDATDQAGLTGLSGGFNLYQLDYNNDGNLDVFVVRGAWLNTFGLVPNSLLKNNGDGTFTDVTVSAGIVSFNPTMVAVCADFNHDGWTDIFVGNDSHPERGADHPNELLLNNGDGTFSELSGLAGVNLSFVIKGLAAADYDNDGLTDLFVSQRRGRNYLLRNTGNTEQGIPQFEDVTTKAGVTEPYYGFTSWFWDYDNDGDSDLYVSQYNAGQGKSAADVARWYAGIKDSVMTPAFYRNNGNGTFTNVSEQVNLDIPLHTMGANFGDIDNDGWLDFYLGTGEPSYMGVTPNRLFRSLQGQSYVDVSSEKGVGHIQKGHGIAFGDIDNDGDQDIMAEMGGISDGDPYQNALFLNPGNENHWVTISMTGTSSSKDAIGTKLKLVVKTDDGSRMIYRTVSSGGSFGASSLRQEIGLGSGTGIDSLIVTWPKTSYRQVFTDLQINTHYHIREGEAQPEIKDYSPIQFETGKRTEHHH